MVSKALKMMKCPATVQQAFGVCFKLGKNNIHPEDLSYKKLKKFIQSTHPLDPYLNDKFKLSESVTVKDHNLKLFDACGFLRCLEKITRIFRKCFKKCFKKKTKKKFEKPSSMKDLPDTDSDASEEGPHKGLSDAAMYVGEGPILFLQI